VNEKANGSGLCKFIHLVSIQNGGGKYSGGLKISQIDDMNDVNR
jgi:hypothetical protein